MTILGAVATDAGGVVWADSEAYAFGETISTSFSKVQIFPLFGLVSVSNGSVLLSRKGAHLLLECAGFDDAFERMPDHLRRSQMDFDRQCCDLGISGSFSGNLLILGFSKRYNQNIIASFCSDDGFKRRLSRNVISPAADFYNEVDDETIRSIAVSQIVHIRREIPGASGGRLVVARLTDKDILTYCLRAKGFENRLVHGPMAGHAGLGFRPCPASSQESTTHREISQNVM